jgi:hypothetical protein
MVNIEYSVNIDKDLVKEICKDLEPQIKKEINHRIKIIVSGKIKDIFSKHFPNRYSLKDLEQKREEIMKELEDDTPRF